MRFWQANQELQKNIKKHQQQVKDLQVMVEEEQRGRDDARDAAARAERRAAELNAELEDLRNQLEQVFEILFGRHYAIAVYLGNQWFLVKFAILLTTTNFSISVCKYRNIHDNFIW